MEGTPGPDLEPAAPSASISSRMTSPSESAVDATDSGFTVTIHESGAGEVSDLVYDGQSGLLVASSYANLLLGTRIDYQLTSWS